jgi:hypothetical protein
MDGTEGKVERVRHRNTNITCSHSYGEAKNVDFIEVESSRVITRGERKEEDGGRKANRHLTTLK